MNSALHSYLILAFTKAERVTMDVGFYYMANAAGRLLGTVLSGLTYQLGGLTLMLGTAAVMVALSAVAWQRGRRQVERCCDLSGLFDVLHATWPAAETRRAGPWTLRRGDGGGSRVSAATLDGGIGSSKRRRPACGHGASGRSSWSGRAKRRLTRPWKSGAVSGSIRRF